MARSAFSYAAAKRSAHNGPSLDPDTDDKRSLGLFNGVFYAFFQVRRGEVGAHNKSPTATLTQATQITGSLLAGVLRQFLASDVPLFLVYIATAVAGTVGAAFIRSDDDTQPRHNKVRSLVIRARAERTTSTQRW